MSPSQLLERDNLLAEAEEVFAVSVLAIAKQMHVDSGETVGEFPCPRCHTGVVTWAATYCHVTVLCSTRYRGRDGKPYRCTSATE